MDVSPDRLVKSPPQKKKPARDVGGRGEDGGPEAKYKLPPPPKSRGKSKSVIARRISSLPKPIEQKSASPRESPKQSPKHRQRDVETQTEGEREEREEEREDVKKKDIFQDIRLCGDLLQEMVANACELSELYEKERRRSLKRQKALGCCAIS